MPKKRYFPEAFAVRAALTSGLGLVKTSRHTLALVRVYVKAACAVTQKLHKALENGLLRIRVTRVRGPSRTRQEMCTTRVIPNDVVIPIEIYWSYQ